MKGFHNNRFSKRVLAFLWSVLVIVPAYAGIPLWTFEPLTATTIAVPATGTALVQYRITNQSIKSHILSMQPIQGVTQITTGANICGNPFVLRGKDSCLLSLQINGSQLSDVVTDGPIVCQQKNPNQCYRPGSNSRLHISRSPDLDATITLNPSVLIFIAGSNGLVTVTNSASSQVAADNIVATIPLGSDITIQNTDCSPSLAIGASCNIIFTSGTQQGPITIPIAGDNTNTVNVDVTVTSQPQITLTSPAQQSRVINVSGAALALQITNNASSTVNADAITVTDKTACPDVSVNDMDCASVAPGTSCTLQLTSSTPYTPCMITIGGSNTASNLTTLVAFSYLGGYIFEASAGNGKVVINESQGFSSRWTQVGGVNIAGATSLDDGLANTNAIIINGACTSNTLGCAAKRCQEIGTQWYLPARNELLQVISVLCSNASFPCNFGNFSTFNWSSSQADSNSALEIRFPSGVITPVSKNSFAAVRCIQAFTF